MNECLRIPIFPPVNRAVLPSLWYLACPASVIKPGQKWPVDLLNRPVLLGRLDNGELFAYRDICPGCGLPLRYGTFENDMLSCCLQGWRYDALDGACIDSPSGADERYTSAAYLRLSAIPVLERYGQVWILSQDAGQASVTVPFFPSLPIAESQKPQISAVMRLPNEFEPKSSVFDPRHPTFVHTSNWWKEEPDDGFEPKRKTFEATALGFRARLRGLKPRLTPYRLFGPEIDIDIEVRLPGLRIEYLTGSRNSACILTAATPTSKGFIDLHCAIYWTMPWLVPAKPILRHMLRAFLKREHDAAGRREAVKQGATPTGTLGLALGERNLETVRFRQIRQEYLASYSQERPFLNPVAVRPRPGAADAQDRGCWRTETSP